jgi:chromate transporter
VIAANSFGGPAAQIAVIHRVIVEDRRWMSESRFVHATGYCMLLPGPEAQQLATYVGWSLHGVRGGLVAGGLFILPGFLSILALSIIYARFGNVPAIEGLFYGLKPAVLGIVLHAVWRLRRRVLVGRAGVALALAAFLAMFVFGVPFPLVILVSALLGAVLRVGTLPAPLGAAGAGVMAAANGGREAGARRRAPSSAVDVNGGETAAVTGQNEGALRPWRIVRTALVWLVIWLAPVALLSALLGNEHVLVHEAVFFSKTAVITFGGAYAVLSYVAQQAVEVYAWLSPEEMLDGLGLTESTPGPLIQVVQFVAFLGAWRRSAGLDPLVAGVLGSIVTTWVTFAPCFLFIFAGAPLVEHLNRWTRVQSSLNGILAAVVGVILNLALWFALHALFGEVQTVTTGPLDIDVPVWATIDAGSVAIAVLAAIAIFRFRAGMLPVLGAGAVLGLLLHVTR